MLSKILAHVSHCQRMLQQTADKSMMYTFSCRMFLKSLNKFLILYKIHLQDLLQVLVVDTGHILHDLAVHFPYILGGTWHIIRRIVLALLAYPDAGNVHLQVSLKTGYHSFTMYKIHGFKVLDPIIEFPDLAIYRPCFIL